MKSARERAIEAIDSMPAEMRERAADYLADQAAKYLALKQLIDEGIADIEAGRTYEWNLDDFLWRACL